MVEMMKAALWTGPEEIEVRDVARPTPGPDDVLIKVAYGGICGTDLMIYLGKHPGDTSVLFCLATLYQRDLLHCGDRISGPALILQMDTTIVLPPEWQAEADSLGNLLLELASTA